MKKILIILFLMLLLIAPVSAKEVTAKVDDKGLIWVYSYGLMGTLHTEYGDIIVTDEDYNNIIVNDTIRYNTDKNTFWSYYWAVDVIR